jgi:SAM-dependent methyltransferase
MFKQLVQQVVPPTLYRPVINRWRHSQINWGNMRRVEPVAPFAKIFSRGKPIDRYYIEAFLHQHQADIRGRVLEIEDATYTHQFGGDRVCQSEILYAGTDNPQATIVGDMTDPQTLPQEAFDCMIVTQTLLLIYDVQAAIANCYAALKPGGVLLVTVPGIAQICRYQHQQWQDYWRFTDASVQRLFSDVFQPEHVTVKTYGNVLTACGFLHGMATEEFTTEELDYTDSSYQIIIGVRACKP